MTSISTDVLTAGLDARVDQLESRWALHGLASNYCHGVDKRDMELFMSIWHDDAVWRSRDGRWAIAERGVEMQYFSPVPGVDLAPPQG